MKTLSQRLVCLIPGGLSVMNASLLAKTIKCSHSHVTIECKNQVYTASDIFGLLSIGIEHGDLITLTASGKDAEAALRNIGMLLQEDIDDVFNPMHSDHFQTALAS